MKLIEAALAYAKHEFSIIPIEQRGKKPLSAWAQYQSRKATAEDIKAWWARDPAANVGIVTGSVSGLIVLDVDSEEAKKKLKEAATDYELDSVPRSRTGRGWQFFFHHPGTVLHNAAGILPGLDLRGDGGYVVAPPSIHPNGRAYKWEVPLSDELPKLPAKLFNLIVSRNGTEKSYRERFYTAQALAGVPEGQRDETLFRLACKLRNADVPFEMAEKLVLEAASNCQPPFPEKLALEKVQRSYARYSAGNNGAEFWPDLITAKELLSRPEDPQRWIWDHTLARGSVSILVAKPKVGKSTLAANLALAVARGIPLLGRATQKAPVAYLYLDGPFEEIRETFQQFALTENDQVFLHSGAVPRDAIAWVVEQTKKNGIQFVIVDVLQKLVRFKKIEDYSEVSNVLEPLFAAVRTEGIHCLFLHHAKKGSVDDDLDAAIGSQALRGLTYTYLYEKLLPDSDRRVFKSDQRNSRWNIPESAIGFDRRTGWLTITGTKEEIEIDLAEPRIVEALKLAEGGLTEKELRAEVPLRGMIVSKAMRRMLKDNQLQRTGDGKKNRPFVYSVLATLVKGSGESASDSPLHFSSCLTSSFYSLPLRGHESGKVTGHESQKDEKPPANTTRILSPEKTGHERDTNGDKEASGHESQLSLKSLAGRESGMKTEHSQEKLQELLKDGWEVV